MLINWRAILSGLAGGVIAALVAGYGTTTGLSSHPDTYTTSDMVWATVVTLVGGVAATVAAWVLNGRRDAGLSGIAAIVSLLGAVGATAGWVFVVAPLTGPALLLMGAILLLGVALIGLAAVCGTTVAVLMPASVQRERDPVA